MTKRQLRFVKEYLVDLNGTAAAIRSGYSPASANEQASRLLAKANIKEAVNAEMEKRIVRTEITQDMVIEELARIAFASMSDLATWNASGVSFKDSSTLDDRTLKSVSAVEETTNEHGGSLKIKQYDKVRALELLGKHLGMFIERVETKDISDTVFKVKWADEDDRSNAATSEADSSAKTDQSKH